MYIYIYIHTYNYIYIYIYIYIYKRTFFIRFLKWETCCLFVFSNGEHISFTMF